ncbi:hypothetical protein IE81DRAFT_178450 [Ceraceosorus guamensis]|uniref:Uncharacterized protein n=1 Tax=Ceraceosorus guamensis TaxID=1522189 RepID=A0A316W115_9BASI|nr:hypothetical protein IE81DRAFT_178450 [Ceraceosorus guamensis]PWN41365.1 hypothetical protein IE81DRAFT_178450 [Ceraceosorus guamensis]
MESSVAAVPPSGKAPTGAAEVSPSLLPVITAQEPNDLTTPRSHAYLASSASTGFATVASTAPPQHPAIPSTEAGQSSRSLPHGYAHLTGPRFGALLRQLDSALGTFPHDEAFSSKGKARVIASTGGISIGDAGFGGSSARQREARYLTSTPGAMSRTALRALRGQPLARIHEDRRRRRKEALVRASTQGSPTTQAKLVPPHAGDDSYAPFSLPKLLERLGGLLRLHSLPPDRALLLARAGWERNDVSSLEARGAGELDRVVSKVCCSTCRAGLSYDAASSRGAESGQSVASGSMKESGDPAVALRMHHFEWCPWSIRWCQGE